MKGYKKILIVVETFIGRLDQWMLGKFHPCHKKQLQLFITVFYCLSLELANIILHVIMHV